MAIENQIHQSFKLFVGKTVAEVDSQVRAFTNAGTVAAKSIGVEFLEASSTLLVSLGYAEGADGYRVGLSEAAIGPFADDAATIAGLEKSLAAAAHSTGNVICHELYMNELGHINMVFLVTLG